MSLRMFSLNIWIRLTTHPLRQRTSAIPSPAAEAVSRLWLTQQEIEPSPEGMTPRELSADTAVKERQGIDNVSSASEELLHLTKWHWSRE
jgi:hypothetical protein